MASASGIIGNPGPACTWMSSGASALFPRTRTHCSELLMLIFVSLSIFMIVDESRVPGVLYFRALARLRRNFITDNSSRRASSCLETIDKHGKLQLPVVAPRLITLLRVIDQSSRREMYFPQLEKQQLPE